MIEIRVLLIIYCVSIMFQEGHEAEGRASASGSMLPRVTDLSHQMTDNQMCLSIR